MSVYHPLSPQPSVTYTCPICLEESSTSSQETVVHTGEGKKHPVHKVCIKTWFESSSNCPTCNAEIDATSLFSWRERCIAEIPYITKDAFTGVGLATIGLTIGFSLKTMLGTTGFLMIKSPITTAIAICSVTSVVLGILFRR